MVKWIGRYWGRLGAAALLAMLGVIVAVLLKIELTPFPATKPRVERNREIAEGVVVSQHGLHGICLVQIGKVQMRKLHKGIFVIGAMNELVLHDVVLNLPEDLWKDSSSSGQALRSSADADGSSQSDPRATLEHLGIHAGHLRMGAKLPRFSALSICGLEVSRLEGTNAVPWFSACQAESRSCGLLLKEGRSIEGGREVRWHEAMLSVKPQLSLHVDQ